MKFPIRRGTNISHWLSQSTARGLERRRRFTRDDVRRLADLGLDHLRLPVDEEQLWTPEGRRDMEAWDLLNEGLDWCRAENLRAVVDLHILRCHYFNAGPEGRTLFSDATAVARFAECWSDLSRELRGRSNDWVAYELLNEPVAEDPADWNRVLRAPYRVIREAEPNRMIAIGSNRWNSVAAYPAFDPPANDPNILLVFHFYSPMLITHYTAPWCKRLCEYRGPIRYPGTPVPEEALATLEPDFREYIRGMNEPFDIEVMERQIEPARKKAAALHLPLWCNEFGVYEKAPDDVRRAWYRDIRTVLERHGIAWANWDFRGGFGLFDRNDQPTVVVDALFGS